MRARELLADAYSSLGEFAVAARHAEHALQLDPCREVLHQRAIRTRALAGDRLGAAHMFERYRRLMCDELGLEPTRETVAMLEAHVTRS